MTRKIDHLMLALIIVLAFTSGWMFRKVWLDVAHASQSASVTPAVAALPDIPACLPKNGAPIRADPGAYMICSINYLYAQEQTKASITQANDIAWNKAGDRIFDYFNRSYAYEPGYHQFFDKDFERWCRFMRRNNFQVNPSCRADWK